MGTAVMKLNDVRRNDVAIAGGKGANLGELAGRNFPVPPGYVVSAKACEEFFQHIGLDRQLKGLEDASPDELGKRCLAIRDSIEKADLPQNLADAIMSAHGELAKGRGSDMVCAVRSSATAEDLGEASFAGQHGTYYYVDDNHLLKKIKQCWASLWSPEAVSYRSTQGIDHASVFMGVVVQEMIQSDVSGVTFTANPVTGSRDEIVIESSWGMGAAIVDGRVTPDHYTIEREGLKLREKRIAEKRFMVPSRLTEGRKERLQALPHEKRHQETLSPDLVRTVAEWAVKAEDHFGSPQDVEWAITDGQFYLLQSRPITTMGRQEIGRDVKGQYVLVKFMAENFTDPLTPLTANMLSMLPLASVAIRSIGWRPYFDLKYFRFILPFKVSDEDLANLLYLSTEGSQPAMKLSLIKLPVFLLLMFYIFLSQGVLYARTRWMPDDFMDGFRKLVHEVEGDPAFGPVETMRRLWALPKLFDPVGNMVLWVNLTAPRYAPWMGTLKKLLRRWCPDVRPDAEALLCSGTQGVLSAEMGRGIWALAREAKRHERVRELLVKHKPEAVLEELKSEPEARDFLDRLDEFLAKNGHRAIKEVELQSVRWEENPAPVLGMIRNYLLVESDPTDHEKKVHQTRAQLEAEIRGKLEAYPLERTFRPRWRLIRFMVDRAKYFAKLRENSRFYHIMVINIVRKKILGIEAGFMRRGKLRCKDDIFFLHWDEIAEMQAGRLGWHDVEGRIHERRLEHVRLSKITPPKMVGIELREKRPVEEPATGEGPMLRGESASPGKYEGLAHVILNPSVDIELRPGEILVAPYTDPAWTPLFLTAGAAVVEVGSFLSHAGTVAREYGLPCLVDVPDCTRRIHSGARLKVDGDLGIVRILTENRGKET